MNCETIDSILDGHLVARLSAAERERAAEHVIGCARCSAAWAADDALRGEEVASPEPELFAAVRHRIGAAAPARREAAGRSRWLWLAGAAAVLAVVAIATRLPTGGAIGPPLNDATTLLERVLEPGSPPELSPVPAPAVAAASPFVAGRDYEVLPGGMAKPALNASGKIEVMEFFMFLCFPCYALEPDLDRWEAQLPDDVVLTRVPAMFKPEAQLQARAYYTAEVLGQLGAMQNAFYDEIHERANALASRAALAEFFQRFGVDAEAFDATFDSSEVDVRMQRAAALNREYAIAATPTLVVAGRYATNPLGADGADFGVVDHLLAEARRCESRCPGAPPR